MASGSKTIKSNKKTINAQIEKKTKLKSAYFIITLKITSHLPNRGDLHHIGPCSCFDFIFNQFLDNCS